MKKLIIGALVGGLLLFIWQFLSWTKLNVHRAEFGYTANQDAVIAALNENLEEGTYMIPGMAPGATKEEQTAAHESAIGKPWALINYHNSYDTNMTMNMIRGFLVNVLAAFLLCWIFLNFRELSMKTAVLSAMAVGVIGYLVISYIDSIWFGGSSIGDLIDAIAQWGLCGAWLGWWLNRE